MTDPHPSAPAPASSDAIAQLVTFIEELDDRSLADLKEGHSIGAYHGDMHDAPDDAETCVMVTRGELRKARKLASALLARRERSGDLLDDHTLRVVAKQLAQKIRSGSLAPEMVALRSEEGMTAALMQFGRDVEMSVRESLRGEATGDAAPAKITVNFPLQHWSKDPLVPYTGCGCGTCQAAPASSSSAGAETPTPDPNAPPVCHCGPRECLHPANLRPGVACKVQRAPTPPQEPR